MERKPIIGLETHVQLDTVSKLFCACSTNAAEPNSSTCPVCLGMPGSKPVLNRKAVEFALRIAVALNCIINSQFFFSRKTYFYPDMAKNYQITQYEVPVGVNGFVQLKSGKKIRIRRIHLEEDPAALVHDAGISASRHSLVDYNRSGIPLVEIVSEPDIGNPNEARDFLDQLVLILGYLGVFRLGVNAMKVDCNVSLQGHERVEVKNITGTRAAEKALGYEIKRQSSVIADGGKIARETRGFDEQTLSTKSLRLKEQEEDYGYIFDADLAMVELSEKEIAEIKTGLPELHWQRAKRFVEEYGIDAYTAEVLASAFSLSNLFLELAKRVQPKLAAAFLTREVSAILNRDNLFLEELKLEPEAITELLKLLEQQKITEKNAKEAMIAYVHKKILPIDFIAREGLLKDLDSEETYKIIERVLGENQGAVSDYRQGAQKAMNFLVGIVMRETSGKADPKTVQRMIEERLKGE